MMRCCSCEKIIPNDSFFCPFCGRSVFPLEDNIVDYDADEQTTAIREEPEKETKSWMLVVVIIGIIAICTVIGLYANSAQSKDSIQHSNSTDDESVQKNVQDGFYNITNKTKDSTENNPIKWIKAICVEEGNQEADKYWITYIDDEGSELTLEYNQLVDHILLKLEYQDVQESTNIFKLSINLSEIDTEYDYSFQIGYPLIDGSYYSSSINGAIDANRYYHSQRIETNSYYNALCGDVYQSEDEAYCKEVIEAAIFYFDYVLEDYNAPFNVEVFGLKNWGEEHN